MELENERQEAGALAGGIAQLAAVAAQLERTAAALEGRFGLGIVASGVFPAGGEVAKMVAAVEAEPSARIAELEAKLQAAEQSFARQIAELRGHAGSTVAAAAGRKTLPAAAAHLLAKHGVDTLEQVNGGALDAALTGLSLEQRIAVKSQLVRAGLLS